VSSSHFTPMLISRERQKLVASKRIPYYIIRISNKQGSITVELPAIFFMAHGSRL
jgi:hypothetical protein